MHRCLRVCLPSFLPPPCALFISRAHSSSAELPSSSFCRQLLRSSDLRLTQSPCPTLFPFIFYLLPLCHSIGLCPALLLNPTFITPVALFMFLSIYLTGLIPHFTSPSIRWSTVTTSCYFFIYSSWPSHLLCLSTLASPEHIFGVYIYKAGGCAEGLRWNRTNVKLCASETLVLFGEENLLGPV